MKTEILVVGGGVIGGSVALLLASHGFECVVVEQKKKGADVAPVDDPRVLALTLASQGILRLAGVWEQLAAADVGRFERMHVWDERGSGRLDFDSAHVNQPTLGYTVGQNVLNKALKTTLAGRAAIEVCTGAAPVRLRPGRKEIGVELSDGREVSAKLLVAADGTGSGVRQLAGIEYDTHPYGQEAVASIVRTELPHEHVARQRFLRTGPIAFLPLADQNQCGVVWSTTPEQAAALLDLGETGFQQSLAGAFESRLGTITESGLRQSFPLQRAQARRYCSDRVALIGDAAHCVHPLAGLGANLGLLDAASLAQVISEARAGQRDFGSRMVLRKYERWRKGENFMVMMALEGLKYLFESQNPPLPSLRNAGMGVFNSIQSLKNFTMRRAMGLDGDLPEIIRNRYA